MFRLAVALILIVEALARWPVMGLFFSHGGVLPAEVLRGTPDYHPMGWSLFFLSDATAYAHVLNGVMLLAACGLLLGWKTRWMTVLCWVLYASLCERNPYFCAGGDLMLVLLLFWGMFLPLGAVWSWDAKRDGRQMQRLNSVPTACLVLQLAAIYWSTAALKSDPVWTREFTAVSYALRLEEYVTPLGRWLLQFPQGLKLVTVATLLVEFAGPLLALLPWWRCRLLAVVMMIGLHLALGLSLKLGAFSWVAISAWLALLPADFWTNMAGRWLPLGDAENACPVAGGTTEKIWRRARDVGLVLMLVCVVGANLASVDSQHFGLFRREPWRGFLQATHLAQTWRMFAPRPFVTTGWFVIEARASDGRRYNLLLGERLRGRFSERRVGDWPEKWAPYPVLRWRTYMLRMGRAPDDVKAALVHHFVRQWNVREGQKRRVENATLLRVQFTNEADGTRSAAWLNMMWPQTPSAK